MRTRRRLCRVEDFYAAAPAGEAVAVIGSSGLLEIAINGGSALKKFGLKIGDRIEVRRR
jgi:S-adenosylmethionine hydrolase